MTILTTVQRATTVLGMEVPTLVYGSTDREMVEMQEVANETAASIRNAFDWQVLQTVQTITGDDVSETFTLPADYDRMLKTASLWSSRWFWSINHITDPDAWLELQAVPVAAVYGNWIMFGGSVHILPVMASTETAKFFYVSKNIVLDDTSTPKPEFSADTDTFRVSERLLKYGIVAKWKQNKGLPYGEAMEDFQRELALEMDKDAGSKPVVSAQPYTSWRSRNIAWPGTLTGAP